MKEHIRKLFDYDHWANVRIIKSLSEMAAPPSEAVKWLDHLLFAKEFILELILHGHRPYPPDRPVSSLAECTQLAAKTYSAWEAYLTVADERELLRVVEFNGEHGRLICTVADLCHHALNHATHHRSQISALIRRVGAEPPGLDYSNFCREHPVVR